MIGAGDLNCRVVLQQRDTSVGGFGQQSTNWTDVATLWARIRPLSGREFLSAAAINSELTHMVTIRYRAGVTAVMRLSYGGQIYNILSVGDPGPGRVTMELRCSTGLNQG